MLLDATEQVVQRVPLRVRRRVKWSECDPAGVVYTGRFCDYVLSAFELFMRHLLDLPEHEARERLGFGTPAKALSLEFLASLRPDDEFEMTVRVAAIRIHTFVLEIDAHNLTGRGLFRATLTPILIGHDDRTRSIELPDLLRASLERYRQGCSVAEATR